MCVCDAPQGVKGALGDPGLPGPTGIRGEFGERVRFDATCLCVCAIKAASQQLYLCFGNEFCLSGLCQ